jgi:hypothetical protein
VNKLASVKKTLGTITTRDGAQVSLDDDAWVFLANGGRHYLRFKNLAGLCSLRMLEASKRALSHSLIVHSGHTVKNYFFHLDLFCKYVAETNRRAIDEFAPADILNYYASLSLRIPGMMIRCSRRW